MNLAAWLLALAWPLAKKVLVALGIGMITYAGLNAVATSVVSAMQAQWGQLPASMIQMASLLGLPQGLGILLGGVMARVSFMVAGRLGKVST